MAEGILRSGELVPAQDEQRKAIAHAECRCTEGAFALWRKRAESCDTSQQSVRDPGGRLCSREDEIGRAPDQRLDLGEIREHLGSLLLAFSVGLVRSSPQPLDHHRLRSGQQHAVVKWKLGLLFRAAGKVQELIG